MELLLFSPTSAQWPSGKAAPPGPVMSWFFPANASALPYFRVNVHRTAYHDFICELRNCDSETHAHIHIHTTKCATREPLIRGFEKPLKVSS
jgi:hypothetical protein